MKNCVIYIPAKGTSQGISEKNRSLLLGKPLISYTLEFSISLGIDPTKIIVSSENDKILDLAQQYSVSTHHRKKSLALPETRVAEVLNDELELIISKYGEDCVIAVLLPTSPFREKTDFINAYSSFVNNPWLHSLVGTSAYPCPIEHKLTFQKDNNVLEFASGVDALNFNSQRQKWSKYYYPNGSLYLVRSSSFKHFPYFYKEGESMGFLTSKITSIDIDDYQDLSLSTFLLKQNLVYEQ